MIKMETKKIDRTSSGLRNALFEELERLRAGIIDPQEAHAIAHLSKTILQSVEMQLKFEKMKLESKVPQNLSEMKLTAPLSEDLSGSKK